VIKKWLKITKIIKGNNLTTCFGTAKSFRY
jgi:hypothetical protein